jgi:hypothetical protein
MRRVGAGKLVQRYHRESTVLAGTEKFPLRAESNHLMRRIAHETLECKRSMIAGAYDNHLFAACGILQRVLDTERPCLSHIEDGSG